MRGKFFSAVVYFITLTAIANANSFELTSVDQSKPFSLRIYCTDEGKAALIQYKSKTAYLALRLKKFTTSVLTNTNKQPEGFYYEWDELVNGEITGSYGVVEQSGKITDAWYVGNKDGKRIKLTGAAKSYSRDEIQKYLLHNVLITFAWTSADDQFMFTYPDGKVVTPNFLSLDAPDARRSSYKKTTILTVTTTLPFRCRMPAWVYIKPLTSGCMIPQQNASNHCRKLRMLARNVPVFAM